MAVDFPSSPTVGATFTSGNNTWQWDGVKWTLVPVATIAGAVRYDISQSLTTPQMGMALRNIGAVYARLALVNGKLVESHASNAATFAVKGLDGNDPSATNPVIAIFTDGSILAITAALSLTIPSSATLGTVSATAFRLWFCLFNDAGTPRIGVRLCSSAPSALTAQMLGFPAGAASSTAISSSSTLVGVTYTGAAVTSKPSVLIGNAEYDSGLTTAGTWAASPSRINLQGAGMPIPGDLVQTVSAQAQPSFSTTSVTMVEVTATRISLTPTSVFNVLSYISNAYLTINVISGFNNFALARVGINGTNQPLTAGQVAANSGAGGLGAQGAYGMNLMVMPLSVSLQTFSLYLATASGSGAAALVTYAEQLTEYVG